MAPREASGTFPDQFLTYDYDASMPMGVAPPVHDPLPGIGGGGTGTGTGTDNLLIHNDDNGPNDLLLQGAGNGVVVEGTTAGTGGGGADALHNHSNTSTTTAAGNNTTTLHVRSNSNSNAAANIDPLSIDPTLNEASSASANSHNSNNGSRNLGPRLPSLGLSVDTSMPPSIPPPQGVSRNASTTSSSAPSSSSRPRPASLFEMDTSSDDAPNTLSQQQGGGQPQLASSSLARAVSDSTATSMSVNSFSLHSGNSIHRSSQSSLQHQISQSILSEASVDESDDEEGDAVPGLDMTYDSGASSTTNSPSNNVAMMMDQETDHQEEDTNMNMNENNGWSHVVEDDSESQSFNGSSPARPASITSAGSIASTGSTMQLLHQSAGFDTDEPSSPPSSQVIRASSPVGTPTSPNSILLSFGPNTTVSDLKYFAERGCIVALLQALNTPRLVTLGTRMLADYAKMSHRRVAVASNRRILEFVQRTMLQPSDHSDWLGREYAVETVRSLTATEESDKFLMGTTGLLQTLALVARGGPFLTVEREDGSQTSRPMASQKARLHACIAIMNLSCGKANKIEIAKVPEVLEAMRDVMIHSTDEARLKATTCIKNLSNADANDTALLGTPGLVEALGVVAAETCKPDTGATPCTTNACLALMNLSISKTNKHRVFRTPGVMDSLMTVLERTTAQGSSTEARIKACSALSNLAIGYDNKIPMFNYPGFVDSILNVILTDSGEARTKACSILWSFAAEMRNQVPVVQRGDILPVLVRVADEDGTTEARFKCVAALTLLAESLDNAIPLLESGALAPLMNILHEAGPDPTQWKGQTASWCVGFLMNIAQSDDAVLTLREAGVVELLTPLLTLDHYQSLKAAMAVTFVCRYDEGDECYDLLRKTENVIPKIISLLHNTLSGRGGNGYKYGVFTLRSSVGCISALASGPDFMKERIATGPVFESLLRVLSDFCVDGGTPGAIVGGGRDDILSATLAVRALQSLTAHLIPIPGSSAMPFGQLMEDRLMTALSSLDESPHPELKEETKNLAKDALVRVQGSRSASSKAASRGYSSDGDGASDVDMNDVASFTSGCCGFESLPGFGENFLHALALPSHFSKQPSLVSSSSIEEADDTEPLVRTFLLTDARTGRRFVVPTDPSGGRAFNDSRVWCYRRGRFCKEGEEPDANFVWNEGLQRAYEAALNGQGESSAVSQSDAVSVGALS